MWFFFLIKCLDFGAEKIKLVSAVSLFRTGNQLFISTAHSCLRHSCQITSLVYTRVKRPNVQLRGKETKLYGDKYVASLGSLCFSGKWGDETQCHGQTTGQILSGLTLTSWSPDAHPDLLHLSAIPSILIPLRLVFTKESQEDRQDGRPLRDQPPLRGLENRDYRGYHGDCQHDGQHATEWQPFWTKPLSSSGLDISNLLKSCHFLKKKQFLNLVYKLGPLT